MFAYLRGRVERVEPDGSLWLDVGGVGYLVRVPPGTAPAVGTEATLYTVVSGQQAGNQVSFTIYGFATPSARQLFERLTGVSGVGPRVALSLLSLGEERLISAVLAGDARELTQCPGVGRKTAERIIFHLREKLGEEYGAEVPHYAPEKAASGEPDPRQEAFLALLSLDFSRREASEALAKVDPNGKDAGQILKEALRILRRQG